MSQTSTLLSAASPLPPPAEHLTAIMAPSSTVRRSPFKRSASGSQIKSPTKPKSMSQSKLRQPKPVIPATADRSRRRTCLHRPAENSLNYIIQRNNHTQLYVRPICWTEHHTKFLGARFEELPPCDNPVPSTDSSFPPPRGHMAPSEKLSDLSGALTALLTPNMNMVGGGCGVAIKEVMRLLWPGTFNSYHRCADLNLVYGDRVVRDPVRALAVWNFPSDSPGSSTASFKSVSTLAPESFGSSQIPNPLVNSAANSPMMAYVGRHHIASLRQNLYRVFRGPGFNNEPVQRLQQLRSRAFVPTEVEHDPHLIGVFVAMAQRHFYTTTAVMSQGSLRATFRPQLRVSGFHDIKLRVMTHDDATAELIVYTALVEASFLDRFHRPWKAPQDKQGGDGATGIKIEYTRVPIWPILGLKERLGQALGADLVGDVDLDNIETWEDAVEASEESFELFSRSSSVESTSQGPGTADTGDGLGCT